MSEESQEVRDQWFALVEDNTRNMLTILEDHEKRIQKLEEAVKENGKVTA